MNKKEAEFLVSLINVSIESMIEMHGLSKKKAYAYLAGFMGGATNKNDKYNTVVVKTLIAISKGDAKEKDLANLLMDQGEQDKTNK